MDSSMWAFSGSKNGYKCDHKSVAANYDHTVVKEFQLKDTSLGYDIMDFPFTSNDPGPRIRSKDLSKRVDGGSAEENDFSDAVLRYIDQVLMEDDLVDVACMIQDSTLHATEKSLYEILNKKYPSSPNQHLPHEETSSRLDDSITHRCSNFSNGCINAYNSAESCIMNGLYKYKSSHVRNPSVEHTFLSNLLSFCPHSSSCDKVDGLVESLVHVPSENQSSWRLSGGMDEFFDFENRLTKAKEKVLNVEDEAVKDEWDLPDGLLRGRKSLHREESDLEEGRSNKHYAVYADESILHEMFDKVLSLYSGKDDSALNTPDGPLPNEASRESQQNERAIGLDVEMTYTKKGASKREAIDMRSLLIKCMESVAGNDHRSARKLLKQIRLRSSPWGDGSQRLAHYFADSLEARLVGAGSLDHKAFVARSMPDADVLKAYKLYLSGFPFQGISYFFAAEMIMDLAEKATSVHIVHFGIMLGLQWPPLIQRLSARPGGPPKLRITGIDLPQAGFRPDARVKETGNRLADYCKRFNVPFEYNGIAQKWETVSVEDIRIEKDEVLVVNCLHQFMHLLDDTIMEHNPRDAVLNLIKRISPDIFIHGIVNGTYNSPFFISRFREALFHFSAVFDMFEANVPRENQERMVFEREIWGKEILNIVACEGLERIQRPETYKQWQIRTLRAGFRQLPLNQEIMKKVRAKVKSGYHKDFFVDEASQWMLGGWKGRVIFAFSCWKPA